MFGRVEKIDVMEDEYARSMSRMKENHPTDNVFPANVLGKLAMSAKFHNN